MVQMDSTRLLRETAASISQRTILWCPTWICSRKILYDPAISCHRSGGPVDAIYLYFRKAFDTIPHQSLLNKQKAYGIVGDINDWISSFLTGCTHWVVFTSLLSLLKMLSGIPQGSVLGPILFVLFINELHDMVRSTTHIFADDT